MKWLDALRGSHATAIREVQGLVQADAEIDFALRFASDTAPSVREKLPDAWTLVCMRHGGCELRRGDAVHTTQVTGAEVKRILDDHDFWRLTDFHSPMKDGVGYSIIYADRVRMHEVSATNPTTDAWNPYPSPAHHNLVEAIRAIARST